MSPSLVPLTASAPRPTPTTAPPQPRADFAPWMAILTAAAVYVVPVLRSVRQVFDWDIWWHLRAGQWIVEHGWVTTTDPFSAYGADKPWLAYSWLFEVLIYGLYQLFGLKGIVVYRAALSLAVVAACHRLVARREPRFLLATVFAGVASLALFPLMNERPWLFTILFSTLTLQVVLDLRDGRRGLLFWFLPLIYVVWANLHIQFVYGFVILGIGCAGPLFDRLLRRPTEGNATTFGTAAWWKLAALSVVCAAATLVNPYGVRLYQVVLEYATQPYPFQVVNELMAMDFREFWDWLALALALVTAFALGRKPRVSAFEVLLFAFAAILCFRARRDFWLVVLAMLTIVPPMVPSWQPLSTSFDWTRRKLAAVAGIVVLMAVACGFAKRLTEERMQAVVEEKFPTKACAVLAERGYSGPLYNNFNWGGYLIWRLPQLPVAMDGRTNLHGEERMRRSIRTWAGGAGWDSDPELLAANVVLADRASPLASLLRFDDRFELVHEDELAVLFLRRGDGQTERGRQ